MSDEADPLYSPLGGLEQWAAVPVDKNAWAEAVDELQTARTNHPDWSAMVDGGMLLAAAYQSGALDGMYVADSALVMALVRGEASLGSIDAAARAHVRANHDALRRARDGDISEDSIRRIHGVACRPQLTHRVRVDDRIQDHVLAAGDYKHHPNHIRDDAGCWRATAPVAQVATEMEGFISHVRSPAFTDLHPVAQAAYLLDALDHVQPFADGNGRVARALAGGCLLRAAKIPFLALTDDATVPRTDLVHSAGVALVDLLTSTPPDGPALDRWRAQEAAGDAVRRRLVPALAEALNRYRHRPDRSRRADLSNAVVVSGEVVAVRVPLDDGQVVDEVITVEAHPEEGDGPVVLTAVEAGLRLASDDPLDPWLDRVLSVLALRVAADLE